MTKNKRLLYGVLFALVLIVANMYQYAAFTSEDDRGLGHDNNSGRGSLPAKIDLKVMEELLTYKQYAVESNLFALDYMPEREVENPNTVVKKPPIKQSHPVSAEAVADQIKVLAVSEHSAGVSAYIRYKDKTSMIKVNDIIDGRYRVVSISSESVELENQGASR